MNELTSASESIKSTRTKLIINTDQMKKLNITSRELQILQFVSDEFTTNEIAQSLFLSRHTVITHRKHLLSKMGARNTAGLVRRGFEMGILVLE